MFPSKVNGKKYVPAYGAIDSPWSFMVGYRCCHYVLFGAIRYAIAPYGIILTY